MLNYLGVTVDWYLKFCKHKSKLCPGLIKNWAFHLRCQNSHHTLKSVLRKNEDHFSKHLLSRNRDIPRTPWFFIRKILILELIDKLREHLEWFTVTASPSLNNFLIKISHILFIVVIFLVCSQKCIMLSTIH